MAIMTPSVLPAKTPSEKVPVYFQLADDIGTDTIVGLPIFACEPQGLDFGYVSSLDGAKTAAALVGGGSENVMYVVSAICTLVSGQVIQPVMALPVVSLASETAASRVVKL